jgi:ABC-type uncharacterized transport system permease subunit
VLHIKASGIMSSRAFDFAAALLRHSFSSPWLTLAAGLTFAWILSSLLAHFVSHKFKGYPPGMCFPPLTFLFDS